ncbi:MAG: hypothetical protein HQK50_05660 [Oligoflexia bacterium]|nr:hypothetical protein [Oligoflexia bacterium]MBF0365036.1 hypothetical protein [Oligoflexia bacterium]
MRANCYLNCLYPFVLMLYLTLWSFNLSAFIIDDTRILQMGSALELGRGYSFLNNKPYAQCFSSINHTRQSSDIDVEYHHSITNERGYNNLLDRLRTGSDLISYHMRDFILEHIGGNEILPNVTNKKRVHVFVSIKVKSYYYSLDESNSKLAPEATALLQNKDQLQRFYEACGTNYIRSIGRYSTFLGLLSFDATTEDRSNKEEMAEKLILSLSKLESSNPNPSNENFDNLSIRFRLMGIGDVSGVGVGVGIGDEKGLNLFPKDLSEFRETLHEVVKFMSDPNAGLISSIEVVPWGEFPFFQQMLGEHSSESLGMIYTKENLEFVAQLKQNAQQMVEALAYTKRCSEYLRNTYPIADEVIERARSMGVAADAIESYDTEKTFFYNLKFPASKDKQVSLGRLRSILSQARIYQLHQESLEFRKEMQICLDNLRGKYATITYGEIPICQKLDNDLNNKIPFELIVNTYCMPVKVESIY